MKKFLLSALLNVLIISTYAQISGFQEEDISRQQALEARLDEGIDPSNLDEWMQLMADRPHYVGTEKGKENAEWMAEQFRSWGYDTRIETYQVLFPYPKVRRLEMTAPGKFRASLEPKALEGDDYTRQGKALLPSYNAFSADGEVEAELVFVNYGVPSDYEELEKMGIDVKGKIVIAKYYGSWRGIKPKLAAEKGAIGCIIYSDPRDDGYFQGDVYPEGAFKPGTGVQRGSVMDMPTYPGDVLTPGYAATEDAERLSIEEASTITAIPVLPISYDDAKPLLEALEGPVAPETWRGALPITYHIGPGPARVHLELEFDWQLKPAYNVIATLEGEELPDEWVIRGNHHDAWVHGASDPVSGMVALMEEARVIGKLASEGDRPKRTIIYCAWDAEEPGLIGSTEWVEDHMEELQQKTVAYINTDGNSRGFLGAGGSHALQTMTAEVAESVTDPQTGVSVNQRRNAVRKVYLSESNPTFKLSALGSGSDYSPFLQHAGIASLNIGYGGEGSGGEYHTIFDSYTHYTKYKDPGFAYGVALAQTTGRLVLRLANADVLPFNVADLYSTVGEYMDEIDKLVEDMRAKRERYNEMVKAGDFKLAADPTKPFVSPDAKEIVPYLDMSPIRNAMASVKMKVDSLKTIDMLSLDQQTRNAINKEFIRLEQHLTNDNGLPRRPWYRHMIYAPGFYTGYGVKTLPGVREAIEEEHWEEAEQQISQLAETLQDYEEALDAILELASTR